MSNDLSNYDLENVEPQQTFELLPPAWYPAMATESSVEPTKSGDGEMAKFRFDVIEGPHEKRVIFASFNVKNPSEKAQAIGRSQLAAFLLACGKPQAKRTEELHEIPVMVKVKIGKAQEGYEAKNEVVGFKPYAAGASSPAPTTTTSSTPAATTKKAPWAK